MTASGLRHYRDRKHLNQSQLAEKVGITQADLSRMETGVMIPTAEVLDSLCAALETPPTNLFSVHILAEIAERTRQ